MPVAATSEGKGFGRPHDGVATLAVGLGHMAIWRNATGFATQDTDGMPFRMHHESKLDASADRHPGPFC